MNEEYQEIDLLELFRALLKKWWLILAFMVVFGGMAFYFTATYGTPIYRAQAEIFIGEESGSLTDISLSDLTMDSQLLADYEELIKTRMITEEVIDKLSLVATRGTLVENLSITIIGESRFMFITFTDPIPERAQLIVNTLADVLADKAEKIMGVKRVQVIDYAITPKTPIGPSVKRNTALAALVGAVIAAGIVFITMMASNTIANEQEIEKMLGVPVLGSIPKFKGAERS